MAVGRGFWGLNRDAVFTKNVDVRIRDRFAGLNGHQKDVAAAASAFLGYDSNVGDEEKAAVFNGADRLLFLGVPTSSAQKEKPPLTPAVRGFLQLLGEIERGIVRLPFVLNCDWLMLNRDSRNIFLIEEVRVLEVGILELALGLADKVIDLRGRDPRDFIFNRVQPARADRQFLLDRKSVV